MSERATIRVTVTFHTPDGATPGHFAGFLADEAADRLADLAIVVTVGHRLAPRTRLRALRRTRRPARTQVPR